MAASISTSNNSRYAVASGETIAPFGFVHVEDPLVLSPGIAGGGNGWLTVTLHSTSGPLGTVADAALPYYQPTVNYDAATNTSTWTRRTFGGPMSSGANAYPDQVLHRMTYTAPTLAAGMSEVVYATVSFKGNAYLLPTDREPTEITATLADPLPLVIVAASLPDKVPPPVVIVPAPEPVVPPVLALPQPAAPVVVAPPTAPAVPPPAPMPPVPPAPPTPPPTVPAEPVVVAPATPPTAPAVPVVPVVTAPPSPPLAPPSPTPVLPPVLVITEPTAPTPAAPTPTSAAPPAAAQPAAPVEPAPAPQPKLALPAPEPETVKTVPPVAVALPVTPVAPVNFGVVNIMTGTIAGVTGMDYAGSQGVKHLLFLAPTTESLAVASYVPDVFIKTGSGNDAVNTWGGSGTNVLDGGEGSNFLVGGTGKDTFFVDARNAAGPTWSTVRNLQVGDAATLWGVTAKDFALSWVDGQGAADAKGLTLHATAAGKQTASLTLSGYGTNDLSNGRLALNFGQNDAGSYLYVVAL